MTESNKSRLHSFVLALATSAVVATASSWGLQQRHDERLSALEQQVQEDRTDRAKADEVRDDKIDQLQRLLIRVDERTAGTDARLHRIEGHLDRLKRDR